MYPEPKRSTEIRGMRIVNRDLVKLGCALGHVRLLRAKSTRLFKKAQLNNNTIIP